ncbi:cytochrome c1-2, heme protein, mitochondrial-like [Canna indica]|uniref:Cytochrome c1-2, heme protein, mitochondrial-like n=1 Tax=Canna indica TaxID=4628 RepID=A0AAQ3QFC0_9LILI|nr:cytochrome c1-2, heme protein, mitochondrial-like [Canna indica]
MVCHLLRVFQIREGLHYNPYFPGGTIAMPKMLIDGVVEYEDGTPATESQMGKDVVTFLSWPAESEMEERKLVTNPAAFCNSSRLDFICRMSS